MKKYDMFLIGDGVNLNYKQQHQYIFLCKQLYDIIELLHKKEITQLFETRKVDEKTIEFDEKQLYETLIKGCKFSELIKIHDYYVEKYSRKKHLLNKIEKLKNIILELKEIRDDIIKLEKEKIENIEKLKKINILKILNINSKINDKEILETINLNIECKKNEFYKKHNSLNFEIKYWEHDKEFKQVITTEEFNKLKDIKINTLNDKLINEIITSKKQKVEDINKQMESYYILYQQILHICNDILILFVKSYEKNCGKPFYDNDSYFFDSFSNIGLDKLNSLNLDDEDVLINKVKLDIQDFIYKEYLKQNTQSHSMTQSILDSNLYNQIVNEIKENVMEDILKNPHKEENLQYINQVKPNANISFLSEEEYFKKLINDKSNDCINKIIDDILYIYKPTGSFASSGLSRFNKKHEFSERVKEIKKILNECFINANESLDKQKILHIVKNNINNYTCKTNMNEHSLIRIILEFLICFSNTYLMKNYNNFVLKDSYVKNYIKSIEKYLHKDCKIYTTNLDCFLDENMHYKVEHLYGRCGNIGKNKENCFLDENISDKSEDYRKYLYNIEYKHLKIKENNGNNIYPLLLFNKKSIINSNLYDDTLKNYFDWNFFKDDTLTFNNILIYGMSFKGDFKLQEKIKNNEFLDDECLKNNVEDVVIIERIKKLQEINPKLEVTITYYLDNEKDYLEKLLSTFGILNVELKNCKEFNFSIHN